MAWPAPSKPLAAEPANAAAMNHQDLVVFVFGAFNALRIVSYLPQIQCVANDCNGGAL